MYEKLKKIQEDWNSKWSKIYRGELEVDRLDDTYYACAYVLTPISCDGLEFDGYVSILPDYEPLCEQESQLEVQELLSACNKLNIPTCC
jgi:hypothetical protein